LLLVVVAVTGHIGKGAQRWLDIGFLRFQPSEIMKLAVPMMCAWYMHERPLPPTFWDLIVMGVLIMIPTAMIVVQPDLGTALLIAASGLIVMLLAGMDYRIILVSIPLLCGAAMGAWHFIHDYQRQRILTFLDPQTDPLGAGYHILQSQIAIGSGRLLGKGLFSGSQTQLGFLPEKHTDFIFSVIGEEMGFFWASVVIIAFGVLVWRAFVIATESQDRFGSLLAVGIGCLFAFQCVMNIGMTLGLLPVTGVALPFVSYGGSHVVSAMIAIGLLQSVNFRRYIY
jgi:rod shape determining protein RodA